MEKEFSIKPRSSSRPEDIDNSRRLIVLAYQVMQLGKNRS